MNKTVTSILVSILTGIGGISSAGADEVVPDLHDSWLTHRVSPQEGRRLLDTVPANKGELWISGGISTAPCVLGPVEQRGESVRIALNGCDEGEAQTGPARLPARIAWRTTGMPELVRYPSSIIPGLDRHLTLTVDPNRTVSLLHLVMSYE